MDGVPELWASETAAVVWFEFRLIYCWSSDPSGDGDHHWTNGGVWQPTEVHVWPGGGVRHWCNAGARPGPPEHGESSGEFDVTPERNHFIYLNPPKTAVKCQTNRWWSDYRSVGLQTANSLSAIRSFNSDGGHSDEFFWLLILRHLSLLFKLLLFFFSRPRCRSVSTCKCLWLVFKDYRLCGSAVNMLD